MAQIYRHVSIIGELVLTLPTKYRYFIIKIITWLVLSNYRLQF